jgi:hypothetical protein
MLKMHGPDKFWEAAAIYHPHGSELFRKFVNGFPGQGESERMNKSVKATRSLKRNRQEHEITANYVELKNWYRMSDSHNNSKVKLPFIQCIRDKIELARNLRNERLATEQLEREAVVIIEEHEQDEDDFPDSYNDDDNWEAEMIDALLSLA